MAWLTQRLSEASSWNAIALGLGGTATFLGTNGAPSVATYVAAVGAGASAIAGFIIKEAGHA